jgi:hypothetical protein
MATRTGLPGAWTQLERQRRRDHEIHCVWCVRRFAPFGISRRLAFRAVWHFAPLGISRRLAFRAVWHFAPSGFRPFSTV